MSVRPALAKLNHSAVRQRRRAVRQLFELDDAEALGGFMQLLEDPDPWFREKAMEAIDRWAASKDLALIERLAASPQDSRRLLAARIANRPNKAGVTVLTGLWSEDDPSIRLSALPARRDLDGVGVPACTSEKHESSGRGCAARSDKGFRRSRLWVRVRRS